MIKQAIAGKVGLVAWQVSFYCCLNQFSTRGEFFPVGGGEPHQAGSYALADKSVFGA